MQDYRNLIAYQRAYQLAMLIYQFTQRFPREERFSLIDQIRRSSRSVCTNIAEAYRKRRYRNYFISKLTDADSENSETLVWIDFCKDLSYINTDEYNQMVLLNSEVGRILYFMIHHPQKFGAA